MELKSSNVRFDPLYTLYEKSDIKLIIQELSYKAKNYLIEHNGKKNHVKAFFIGFANGSQYGNNIFLSPLSNINDGEIEVVIVKKFPKWKIPIIVYMMLKGNIHLSKHIKIIKTKHIIINVHEDPLCHIDGEPMYTQKRLEIKTQHKSLNIMMPNEKK